MEFKSNESAGCIEILSEMDSLHFSQNLLKKRALLHFVISVGASVKIRTMKAYNQMKNIVGKAISL